MPFKKTQNYLREQKILKGRREERDTDRNMLNVQ